MAKRNIRKTDPDIASTPDSREAATTAPNGRADAPKPSRSRRKADAPVAAAVPQPEPEADVTSLSAEAGIEAGSATHATRDEDQPRTAASPFTTVAEVAAIELSHDQIAERAYHLYLARDRQPGDPFADWLTAERELRERFVGA